MPIKISEFIKLLQSLQTDYGDLDIECYEPGRYDKYDGEWLPATAYYENEKFIVSPL